MAKKVTSQAGKVVKRPPNSKGAQTGESNHSSSGSLGSSSGSGNDSSSSDGEQDIPGNAEFTPIPRFGGKQIRFPTAASPDDSDSESYASIESGEDDDTKTKSPGFLLPRKYQLPDENYRMSIFLRDHLLDLFLSNRNSTKIEFNEEELRRYTASLSSGNVRRSGDQGDLGWNSTTESQEKKGENFAQELTSSLNAINTSLNEKEKDDKDTVKEKRLVGSSSSKSKKSSKKKKKKSSESSSHRKNKHSSRSPSSSLDDGGSGVRSSSLGSAASEVGRSPSADVALPKNLSPQPKALSPPTQSPPEIVSSGRETESDYSAKKRPSEQNPTGEIKKKVCVLPSTSIAASKDYSKMDPVVLKKNSENLFEEARKLKHQGDKVPKTDTTKRADFYLRSSLRFFEYSLVLEDLKYIWRMSGDLAKSKYFGDSVVRILPQTGSLVEVAARAFENGGRKDLAAMSCKFAGIVYMYIFRCVRLKLEAVYNELNQAFKSATVLGTYGGLSSNPVSPLFVSTVVSTSSSPVPFTGSPPPTGSTSNSSSTVNGAKSSAVSQESYSYFLKEIGFLFRGYELWSRSQRLDSKVLPTLTDLSTVNVEFALKTILNELEAL